MWSYLLRNNELLYCLDHLKLNWARESPCIDLLMWNGPTVIDFTDEHVWVPLLVGNMQVHANIVPSGFSLAHRWFHSDTSLSAQKWKVQLEPHHSSATWVSAFLRFWDFLNPFNKRASTAVRYQCQQSGMYKKKMETETEMSRWGGFGQSWERIQARSMDRGISRMSLKPHVSVHSHCWGVQQQDAGSLKSVGGGDCPAADCTVASWQGSRDKQEFPEGIAEEVRMFFFHS